MGTRQDVILSQALAIAVQRLCLLSVVVVTIVALRARGVSAQSPPPEHRMHDPGAPRKKVLTVANPVPNQYIVVLNDVNRPPRPLGGTEVQQRPPTSPAPTEMIQQIAKQHRVVPLRIYTTVLRGFMTRCSPQQAEDLANDPRIKYVEQDGVVRAFQRNDAPVPPWGLDRIDQVDLPLDSQYNHDGVSGQGVNVYVFDTGIQTVNPDFEGRADSVFPSASANSDCNGHGTQVAGVIGGKIFGVAKAVRLHSVQVLDCNGLASGSSILDGIEWLTNNRITGPAVANLSLGRSAEASLNQAVQTSISYGIVYVVAAGNEGENACNDSPAGVREAITVGATFIDSDNFDERASFSAVGPCVTLFAPGVSIATDWKSNEAPSSTFDGTSASAPHVAGIVALYLQKHPDATPAQTKADLVAHSTPAKVRFVGDGSPNNLAYMGFMRSGSR